MLLLNEIAITFIKALFYAVLIIIGVFAGKKYRDYKDKKKKDESIQEIIVNGKKEKNNE